MARLATDLQTFCSSSATCGARRSWCAESMAIWPRNRRTALLLVQLALHGELLASEAIFALASLRAVLLPLLLTLKR